LFVGYSEERRAYRLYDITTKKYVEARNVTFLEDVRGGDVLESRVSSESFQPTPQHRTFDSSSESDDTASDCSDPSSSASYVQSEVGAPDSDGSVNSVSHLDEIESLGESQCGENGDISDENGDKSGENCEPLSLIHVDVCGAMSTASVQGSLYILVIVDDATRRYFVMGIRRKSQVVDCLRKFKAVQEKQTGCQLKKILSDNGAEICNQDMEKFCTEFGIVHRKTVRYTPKSNSIVERANQTLMNGARSLLVESGLPNKLFRLRQEHSTHQKSIGK